MEKATYNDRILLTTPKVRSDLGHQLLLMLWPLPANCVGLGIVVEKLVGVEIWAVQILKRYLPQGLW